jgi:hypothetical protein
VADFMVSDGTNFSEFIPSKADGIVDYNNPNNVIKLGWAGNGFTAADFNYALGLNNDKKIKDVSKSEYKKWLGLDAVNNTADARKSVKYANEAGLIKDSNDGRDLKVSYSAAALPYSGFTWIAAYDGNTLKTINKNMFAQASHTHSEYAANDVVTISSTQPTSDTCKLWIKI